MLGLRVLVSARVRVMIIARIPISIKISIGVTVSHLPSVRLELLLGFGLRL